VLKAVLVVLLLLVGLCYAGAFLTWNGDTKVNLVTWHLGGDQRYVPNVPAGLLPIVGTIIGALVMAFAAWGPWASQRRAARAAEAKVQKAIEKFNEQKGRLAERNEEIGRLQERIGELEQSSAAAVGAPAVGPEVSAADGAPLEEPPQDTGGL
jgi:hypothetical protein